MKYVKSVHASSLSDVILKSVLIIVSTKLEPQLEKIVVGKDRYYSSD
jgi:hypothetical protein